MKQIVYLIPLLLINELSVAQNCNFKVNEKDEFTNKNKKTIESIIFKESNRDFASMEFKNIDSKYTVIIHYYRSPATGLSKFSMYSTTNQDKIYFKLVNGDILNFSPVEMMYFTKYEKAPALNSEIFGGYSKKNKYIFEPEYYLTKTDLLKLVNNKIDKIRIECKAQAMQTYQTTDNLEFSVIAEFQEKILTNASCIIQGDTSNANETSKDLGTLKNISEDKPNSSNNTLITLLTNGKWNAVEVTEGGNKHKPTYQFSLSFTSDYKYNVIASYGYEGNYELSSDGKFITLIPLNKSIPQSKGEIVSLNDDELIIKDERISTTYKKQ